MNNFLNEAIKILSKCYIVDGKGTICKLLILIFIPSIDDNTE
ncbi:hypothetical protein GPX-Vietnam_120.5 [Goatpox virus]|uniref:Uncharacterized protein n=3 Tax=Capripoxvirus TaxID=10265 RepID=A0A1B2LPR8_9POXV|nr:hypothetical protein GTPV_gp115.5L [Goatpox virus Pellor]AGZ95436.1 hypothetical protein [Goatpox virus FZ]AOA33079.1 hypothetical protein GTPV_gp115.5L [Goatpox virus]QEJ78667.1 hypothetical protein LSD-Kenya_120.5 [Lumpy skin disease virus]AXA19881.1 hypothetical protein [Goatpox virus]QEJ78820.1 hypothetical protein GPX-India_120.5 [Goatpox virus]